jgi:hypothetical protein
MTSEFGRGLKRDTPERVSHRLGGHLHPEVAKALAAGPVGRADLSAFRTPSRLRQRYTSTCHAHSRAAGLYTAWKADGRPLAFVPSPLMIAACTYADRRSGAVTDPNNVPVLRDDGAELQESSDATVTWGIAPMLPFANAYTDVPNGTADPAAVFPEPDYQKLEIGGENLQAPEYLVTPNQDAPLVLCAYLDLKIPSQTGGPVGPAYEALGKGQIAMPEPDGEGHAQVCDGYDTMTDDERRVFGSTGQFKFTICNSWGAEWCDDGIGWASEEWIRSQWSFFPFTLPKAA